MLWLKVIGGIVYTLPFFGFALFLPAGTIHWWRAWVFLAVVFVCVTISMVGVLAGDEELLNERYADWCCGAARASATVQHRGGLRQAH